MKRDQTRGSLASHQTCLTLGRGLGPSPLPPDFGCLAISFLRPPLHLEGVQAPGSHVPSSRGSQPPAGAPPSRAGLHSRLGVPALCGRDVDSHRRAAAAAAAAKWIEAGPDPAVRGRVGEPGEGAGKWRRGWRGTAHPSGEGREGKRKEWKGRAGEREGEVRLGRPQPGLYGESEGRG